MAKKRYRVVAEDTVVAGHKTGEEFEYDFSQGGNEEALIEGGHIEIVKPKSSKPKEKEGE